MCKCRCGCGGRCVFVPLFKAEGSGFLKALDKDLTLLALLSHSETRAL